MGEQTLAEKAEMFSQLGKLPLAKNPFFIKSIANSGQFDGEGTEGMAPGNLTSQKNLVFISQLLDIINELLLLASVFPKSKAFFEY